MVTDARALEAHWNRVLEEENLGVIESGRCILSEYIFLSNGRAVRLAKAEAWLSEFSPQKLEKIRKGPNKGAPNFMHKRVVELYIRHRSTRRVATTLLSEGYSIGFQGVAKILLRYLGD